MYTFFSYTGSIDRENSKCSIHYNEYGNKASCFDAICSYISKKANEVLSKGTLTADGIHSVASFEASRNEDRVWCKWNAYENGKYVEHSRIFHPIEVVVPVNTDNVEITADQRQEKSEMRNYIIEHFNRNENKFKTIDSLVIVVDDLNVFDKNERCYRVWKVQSYLDNTLTLLQNTLTGEFIAVNINYWSYNMLKALYEKIK